MKIANNSNVGDIIINGKKINDDVEIINNKAYIKKKETNKFPLSIRIDEDLYREIEKLEKNLSMSKTEICKYLLKQGLNSFSFQDEIIFALDTISKLEKTEEKRILYLFLTLTQVKNRIKLNDINFLAGTNITAKEFMKICQNIPLNKYFEDI